VRSTSTIDYDNTTISPNTFDDDFSEFLCDSYPPLNLMPLPSDSLFNLSTDEMNTSQSPAAYDPVSWSNLDISKLPSPSPSQKPKSTTSPSSNADAQAIKRSKNTLAARKSRQKRLDRISQLDQALKAMEKEKDEWKTKALKLEGEVGMWRQLCGAKGGNDKG